MINQTKMFVDEREALPLPDTTITRSGASFDPSLMQWKFRDTTIIVSINFALLPNISHELLNGLKRTLIWYFENRAPKTAMSQFNDFLWLVRLISDQTPNQINFISAEDIGAIAILSNLAMYRLSHIRGFFTQWFTLNNYGINKEVLTLFEQISPKQSPVGVAVATLDDKKGPLTDLEFEEVQIALNNAYANSLIEMDQLILCYLIIALGARPTQLASLKCVDLIAPSNIDGDYFIKVPRAKQREQLVRSEFKIRKLTRQLGDPLLEHVKNTQRNFAHLIEDPNELPLFPIKNNFDKTYASGYQFHSTPYAISSSIINIFKKLKVPSERLSEPMNINAIRFRRTFATRAAEEGWPLLIVAELMDHENTKNIQVYSGLTTRIRAEFSRKIAMEMAPLAIAFSGKIIKDENEASRPGSISKIVDLRVDKTGLPMGSCGSSSHCGFARPIACYGGCMDFEPWLDGPHEQALDYMIARREMLMTTTDSRIASINDRAILGCAQIILRCRELKGE